MLVLLLHAWYTVYWYRYGLVDIFWKYQIYLENFLSLLGSVCLWRCNGGSKHFCGSLCSHWKSMEWSVQRLPFLPLILYLAHAFSLFLTAGVLTTVLRTGLLVLPGSLNIQGCLSPWGRIAISSGLPWRTSTPCRKTCLADRPAPQSVYARVYNEHCLRISKHTPTPSFSLHLSCYLLFKGIPVMAWSVTPWLVSQSWQLCL